MPNCHPLNFKRLNSELTFPSTHSPEFPLLTANPRNASLARSQRGFPHFHAPRGEKKKERSSQSKSQIGLRESQSIFRMTRGCHGDGNKNEKKVSRTRLVTLFRGGLLDEGC
ncbi:hypothetical protein CEXT_449521 [Caerostris extrusa]|uniref:Uncharacterized protein n=1 Tax=Caerostris extrusa TaxID=172846 RepID=A0AAV4Q8X5_CAEEX|nr:hypothetical protein CEXT_449521 [Caerostris extrusa]